MWGRYKYVIFPCIFHSLDQFYPHRSYVTDNPYFSTYQKWFEVSERRIMIATCNIIFEFYKYKAFCVCCYTSYVTDWLSVSFCTRVYYKTGPFITKNCYTWRWREERQELCFRGCTQEKVALFLANELLLYFFSLLHFTCGLNDCFSRLMLSDITYFVRIMLP